MTALLDHLESPPTTMISPAQRLRATMAAVRLSFTWLGTKKSLTPEQKAQAAAPFDADEASLTAAKKLLDTRHAAYRAVTAVRGKIGSHWRSLTIPFPEPGVRLIRQDKVETFADQMAEFKADLDDAVANLDRHFAELKDSAAERLGQLFDSADYPHSLAGLFDVAWDFPNVEPPDYLTQFSPALYEQERARVTARFEEAVRLAETAFLDEFSKLVAHLCERLTGDGHETKVFRDSAVNNLSEFFERFRSLNVGSSKQLEALVAQAQRAVRGFEAQSLRDSKDLRQRVATQLSRVQSSLDGMMIDRPRRRILRPVSAQGET